MHTKIESRGIAGVLAAALLAAVGGAAPSAVAAARPSVAVVVQASDVQAASHAVTRSGGVVDRELDVVGGVAARVAPDAVQALDALAGIEVTRDELVSFASTGLQGTADRSLQLEALNPPAEWSTDTGSGVGVALIDTGVAETPDLAGRVVHGPDYSDEGDGVDRYGHGTFMAGLIAGDGTASTGAVRHYGTAPGAHIVSVKLAGRDGVTTLSKVLDAIGWVVVNQDEHGIRVLNLSIGVPTKVAPQADPLSAAVEAAWASGITVVAASGNEGEGVVTSPGRDPWVISVGSTDTNGTVTTSDDTVASWSGSGRVTSTAKPEIVAPGASVVSLRAPGSLVDESFPDARVDDDYFRGSGTSMSTAIVSGAVAALAELRPWATPDDLKGALVSTGQTIAGTTARAVDLAAADAASPDDAWRQRHPVVFDRLDGRLSKGMPWAQQASPSSEVTWSRARWADGAWTRARWARARWADAEFARARWADAEFARARWADANFARARWADAHFTRARWAEADWARARWAGDRWADDRTWVRARWASAMWEGQGSP